MLSIYDKVSARAALDQPLEPSLRTIITNRLADAASIGLSDQTHIIVIRPGDTEAMLLEELGWSPLVNPMTEARFGETGFTPYWSWLQDLGGWFELIHTVGNSGFAYTFLVEDAEDSLLAQLCRRGGVV